MTSSDVIDLGQQTLWVLLKVGAPLMLVTLVVGFTVSLLQALTQIQEMTLAFIPKILATFAALLFALPYIGRTLETYTQEIFNRIIGLGA